MARRGRFVVSGIPHHIVNKGNRRQKVFFQASDYEDYINLLSNYAPMYGVKIVSYCLMSNHIHLIAIPSKTEALSQFIGDSHQAYTRMVNFREGWRGHLWQGRFFSCAMDKVYTLRAARYIELNPVKAKLVKDFGEYKYSSAGYYLGKREDKLISENYFGFTSQEWQSFVEEGLNAQEEQIIKQHVQTGRPLGKKRFIEKLELLTGKQLERRKPGPKSKT